MQILFFSNPGRKGLSVSLGPAAIIAVCLCFAFLFLGFFFSGIRFATNHSSALLDSLREQTASVWLDEFTKQEEKLNAVRLKAEKSLDAMASRLSLLQGHVMRLDALGTRLAAMADLNDMEFGVDNPPGMGGPAPENEQQSMNIPDFLGTLDRLEEKIRDRSEKLSAMESMLINRTLQEQTLPAGRPAKDGWISSLYGYRSDPMTGKREFHEGLDFAGKPGMPIAAVAAGIVTWSGPRYGYGNLVEISHGSGYITRYAHNQKNLVTVGEKVEKGEVIAVMGNSGRSTGTHVHFEVLRNGQHVNPKQYIVLK
ncbi:MAG: peptidoglycan DD-metalloendopeptidase family protein [Gammaproteobacteria bacterium]